MKHRIAQLYRGSVKRVLSTAELFAVGYGDLGSSIYYALGITTFFALGATPIAMLAAGFIFACTALSYAELSSMYPESGGSASFARHAFNDLISFIAGWALLLDYIVTIAISSFAISPYLAFFFPHLRQTQPHIITTIALIILLFFLNLFGVRKSTKTSVVLTSGAIVTQIIIIGTGLFTLTNLSVVVDHLRLNVNADWSATTVNFFKGVAMAMVAYTGIESIAQLGSEAKNPTRSLPKSFCLNIIALLLLYVGLMVVAFSALAPVEIGTTYRNDPIAGIAAALPYVGPYLVHWVGLFAAILLFVASDAGMLGASRLSFNMGEYYQLPRVFFRLHPRLRTPYNSLAIFAILSIALILFSKGRLEFLADLYNFGVMIAFFFTNLSLILLRIKRPKQPRPFKIPFSVSYKEIRIPLTALIGLVAAFAVWLLVVVTKPHARYLGIAWMVFGTIAFWVYRKKIGISPASTLHIQKIEIPHLKEKVPKRILVAFQKPTDVATLSDAIDMAKKNRAELIAIYILEVPHALPLDALLHKRTSIGQTLLDRAEAFARDQNQPIELEMIRGREFAQTLLATASEKKVDMIVLGLPGRDLATPLAKSFDSVEKIIKTATCPVVIRYHYPNWR